MGLKLSDLIHLGATSVIRFELSPQCGEDISELAKLLNAWISSPFFGRIPASRRISIGVKLSQITKDDRNVPPINVCSRYLATPFSEPQVVDLQSRFSTKSRLPLVDQYILRALKPTYGLANLYSIFERYDTLEHRVTLDSGVVLEGPLSTLAHVTLIANELKVLGVDSAPREGNLTPEHVITDEHCLQMLLPTCSGLELRQQLIEQSARYISVSECFYGLIHSMLPEVTRWVILQPTVSELQESDELSHGSINYKRYRISSRLRMIIGWIFARLEHSTPVWMQRYAGLLLFPFRRMRRLPSSAVLYSMEPVMYHTWKTLQDSIEISAKVKR